MQHYKYFILFVGILLITVGCSNGIEVQGNELTVQKRIGEENKYESFKVINEEEDIKRIKNLLNGISWTNAIVDMAYPPHYKFYFNEINEDAESNRLIYHLWVSPNKDKIEISVENEGKYIQLNENTSTALFELITGKKLSEEK